jgi:lysophospholipase L1-like esterase
MGDKVLINFGLHDYNLGLEGVPEYTSEYRTGLLKAQKIANDTGATITILGTTPAHNTATKDDVTVVGLNKAAQSLAQEFGFNFVDLHTPLIAECGPTPWADNGTDACPLCAPSCKKLSVHYTPAGYNVIANLIWNSSTGTAIL